VNVNRHVVWASLVSLALAGAIVGSATILAGVLEPAWEYFIGDAPFEWAFGAERNTALATFVGTGLAAHVITLLVLGRVRQEA
jgi:hypothetical protein